MELRTIPELAKLKDYPFYPAAQGEFHLLAGRAAEAGKHFEEAMQLAQSRSETNFFGRKLEACRLAAAQNLAIDQGCLLIDPIEVIDGTPVIDIKPVVEQSSDY
jgi:hypothetical protein